MRVAIVATHPVQYYAPVFALLTRRRQVDVKVFYTWGNGALNKYDPGFGRTVAWDVPLLEGYKFEWVENTASDPGSHRFDGIINPGLIGQIVGWQAEALLIFGWAYHSHLKLIRHFHNKLPVFFRGDSTLLDEQHGIKSLIKAAFLKWVYKHIDYAFFTGRLNREYFLRYGLEDDRLIFAPHAVDNVRFADAGADGGAKLRGQLGLTGKDVLLLFAGKLEQKKAPEELLSAFLQMAAREHVHLLFAGNGEMEGELKQAARNNAAVHFLDFQNQSAMPAVYHACDLFCLPSRGPGETWGLAVNEAMACGKAILVSDRVGSFPDLVVDGQNGKIFQSGNREQLVRLLEEMTASKAELQKMGLNSAEFIKNWNFTRIAEAFEKTFLTLDHGTQRKPR